jgi:hypothetical protein
MEHLTKGDRVKFSRYYDNTNNYKLKEIENGEGTFDGIWNKVPENKDPHAPFFMSIVSLKGGGMLMVNPDDLQKID